jgi:hypothetical protein
MSASNYLIFNYKLPLQRGSEPEPDVTHESPELPKLLEQ